MADATRLTDLDRKIIAQAREWLALPGADAFRSRYGYENNTLAAFVAATGEAQEVIAGLLAIVAGLDGDAP